MSNPKCDEALDVRQKNAEHERFIQKVHDEDNYCKIVDWSYMQSIGENPYQKSVKSQVRLGHALKEDMRNEFVRERRRQQLRQDNHELRDFESQIRAAYCRKTMAVQVFEKEAIKNRTLARQHERKRLLMEGRMDLGSVVQKIEEENRAKKEAHKLDLMEQMAEMRLKQQEAHEKLMKDKRDMDAQVDAYLKMREREYREDLEQKARTKLEMEEVLRSKVESKLLQRANCIKEEEKVLELARERELQAELAEKEKKEEQLRKDERKEKIGIKFHNVAMEKIKARDTLAELLLDEHQAKQEAQTRQELERQMQCRDKARRLMKRDLEEMEHRKENQKKIDREIFEEQMRVLAEQDRIDQLSDEKRRKKQLEHRRSLLDGLDEKKRLKSKYMLDQLAAVNERLRIKEELEDEVEQERIRLVMEHGPDLIDYLAPSALRESDHKLLSDLTKQN